MAPLTGPHMKINKNCIFLMGVLISTLFCYLISSCSFHSDSFYNQGSGLNYVRFPLLKPYYAIADTDRTDEKGWVIPLKNESPLLQESFLAEIIDVKKIAVVDNMILAYTPYSPKLSDNSVAEKNFYWFVLIPDKHIEIGFEQQTDFISYIRQYYDVDNVPWQEPSHVLQSYDQTGCLEWIPDCK